MSIVTDIRIVYDCCAEDELEEQLHDLRAECQDLDMIFYTEIDDIHIMLHTTMCWGCFPLYKFSHCLQIHSAKVDLARLQGFREGQDHQKKVIFETHNHGLFVEILLKIGHFEDIYIEHGEDVYRIVLKKNDF